MAAHTCLPQMFYAGAWHVLTPAVDPDGYALAEQKTKITRGFPADGSDPRPAKIEFSIYDPLDKYRPTNPMSPIYGQAGQNSPVAVSSDGSIRAVAQASVFKPDQTVGFQVGPPQRGLRWVDIEAEGVLRQIGLWTDALRSPVYRNTMGTLTSTLLGYWAGEDQSGATQLSNAVPNGAPGQAAGVTFQGMDGPDGSDKTLTLSVAAASSIGGKFIPASSTAGWQVSFAVNLALLQATTLPVFTWRSSNGYTWSISADNFAGGSFTTKCVDRNGTTLTGSTVVMGTLGTALNQWLRMRVKVTAAAGTVSMETAWYRQGAPSVYGITDTFAGTVGSLSTWISTANAATDGASIAHVLGVTTGVDDLLDGGVTASFNGYVGETAGDRFKRLCTEQGVGRTLVGAAADTWLMGRQRPDTFLNLLKEIARTEDALIFDTRGSLGLTMRTRHDRYNQAVKVALTYGVDVGVPLLETISDVDAHNRVTISQADGGDVTLFEATGPMSVLAPPNGIGEYRQTVEVNVADETGLAVLGGWWLSKGTVPGARYESVVLDLDLATPPNLAAANSVDIGDRITIAGRTPDTLELIVIGIYEEIETHARRITLTTVPGGPWLPAVYDGGRRYGITGSTTVGTMTTTFGTVTAALTTDRYGTALLPYDIMIAGERMRVTSVFTSGVNQGLNVTRSINGVVKAHVANEPIQIHDDQLARYGL